MDLLWLNPFSAAVLAYLFEIATEQNYFKTSPNTATEYTY